MLWHSEVPCYNICFCEEIRKISIFFRKKSTLSCMDLDKSGYLGPVVQSVVSLTSSLRVISLTVLVDSIYSILIFFAEKM